MAAWISGSTAGLLLSGDEANQLSIVTVLAAIVIVFALSFLVVPRGR